MEDFEFDYCIAIELGGIWFMFNRVRDRSENPFGLQKIAANSPPMSHRNPRILVSK